MKRLPAVVVVVAFLILLLLRTMPVAGQGQAPNCVRFAVIGDYGAAGSAEADVAALVAGWNPDLIVTTGDNNYPDGEAATIDENIGQYYSDFIYPYSGDFGDGADTNRFFPAPGNHDWHSANLAPYVDYFSLPNNERYYDFVWGPVHFLAVDSDPEEPDGNESTSVQGTWIEARLRSSRAPWQIVYMHHPPHSSGRHGSSVRMQWPYKAWGADLVLAGHDHTYERLQVDGLSYIVNGLGGRSIYDFDNPLPESRMRYNGDYGAMRVDACQNLITSSFVARDGALIDTFVLASADFGSNRTYLPLMRSR